MVSKTQQHNMPAQTEWLCLCFQRLVCVCMCVYVRTGDMENQAELEEKTRLINQVLGLQHTLEGEQSSYTHEHTPTEAPILTDSAGMSLYYKYVSNCKDYCNLIANLDLSARVDAVKEENLKLKSENQVLGQYIENLMSASSVFQTTDTKSKRK